jgi:hypothetical protein
MSQPPRKGTDDPESSEWKIISASSVVKSSVYKIHCSFLDWP